MDIENGSIRQSTSKERFALENPVNGTSFTRMGQSNPSSGSASMISATWPPSRKVVVAAILGGALGKRDCARLRADPGPA